MYCRKCGKEVQDNQEYCEACKEEMKTLCPYCGKKTNPYERFCEHCEGYLGNLDASKETPKVSTTNVAKQEPQTKNCQACGKKIPKTAFYCPVCNKIADVADVSPTYETDEDTGSYGVGFLLGFLTGLIGLIVGLAIGKSDTTRGALLGFFIQLIISVVFGVIAYHYFYNWISNLISQFY